MSENCYVCNIPPESVEKLKHDLQEQNFDLSEKSNMFFFAKKVGISIAVYKSGKMVIQGSDIRPFIEFYLEPEILKNFTFTNPQSSLDKTPRIGVDEAGKGDYFGPISICGVMIQENQFESLIKLGVKDSKKITDSKIISMSEKIKEICAYEAIVIFPQKYNLLYEKFKNLNKLLAWAHAKTIELLNQKTGCKIVIVDQFATSKAVIENALGSLCDDLTINQRHKAEEDLAVAAASIIARANFLKGLEKLSNHYEIEFPKGASDKVKITAKEFISKYGKERLHEVAKLHFKTTQEI